MGCAVKIKQEELARDMAACGRSLAAPESTRFADEGAHDPTASHYFVLDKLFAYFGLSADSHLLDVGCGAGRVLAYFAQAGCPGKVTGVELDPVLAAGAQQVAAKHPQAQVKQGSVLDIDLSKYTCFYLFNPFDTYVLLQFLDKLEREGVRSEECPIVLAHMSDNGENYNYMGRPGWSLKAEGWIHQHEGLPVFDHSQHWSVWELR